MIVSPQDLGLWDPLQMAFSWLINGGDPKYLLTGMILQVRDKMGPPSPVGSGVKQLHFLGGYKLYNL